MAQREALIVATGRYDDPELRALRSPAQDAAELGRVLRDERIGAFHVEQVVDQGWASIQRALHRFFADRSRDDVLLLHLSCHGIKDDEGRLYFAGTDTTRDELEVTAVPAAFLNDQMDRCRARSILLLLDCCYAGAFAAGSKGDSGVHLKEKFEGHGRVILTASNAIEYSWEGGTLSGQGKPSVFTAAIVEGLESGDADRDGDGRVSPHELHEYVSERMLAAVPKQTPLRWELGIEGGLYIARNPRPRLHRELLDALAHPLPGVRVGVVSELARLLDGSPALAGAAREALEGLRHDDSLRVRRAAGRALGGGRRGRAEPPTEEQRPTGSDETTREDATAGGGGDGARGGARGGSAPPTDVHQTPRWTERAAVLFTAARRHPRVLSAVAVAAVALVIALRVLDGTASVTVDAQREWNGTGIVVEAGDRIEITATGTVCDNRSAPDDCEYGPEGEPDPEDRHRDPFEDANHAALLAAVGGTVEVVGAGRTFIARESGPLSLGVNDGVLDDNSGAYTATIKVHSSGPPSGE